YGFVILVDHMAEGPNGVVGCALAVVGEIVEEFLSAIKVVHLVDLHAKIRANVLLCHAEIINDVFPIRRRRATSFLGVRILSDKGEHLSRSLARILSRPASVEHA